MSEADGPSGELSGEFEEHLITGYIDGVLTQSERQKVRLRIEENQNTRALYEHLKEVREAQLDTPFELDDQWNEQPRGMLSRWLRNLGFFLLIFVVLGFLSLLFLTPEEDETLWVRLLAGGLLGSLAALFLSALIDRISASRSDIYIDVKR